MSKQIASGFQNFGDYVVILDEHGKEIERIIVEKLGGYVQIRSGKIIFEFFAKMLLVSANIDYWYKLAKYINDSFPFENLSWEETLYGIEVFYYTDESLVLSTEFQNRKIPNSEHSKQCAAIMSGIPKDELANIGIEFRKIVKDKMIKYGVK